MTRRELLSILPAGLLAASSPSPVNLPVRLLIDGHARWRPQDIGHFWKSIWPEAVRDFAGCGVQLQTTLAVGEVAQARRDPVIWGLASGVLNVVLTDRIPARWDPTNSLCGVTTRYRGYHVCMIAINHAHGHQIPWISVNTCTHELLHAILLDVFESRPHGAAGEAREFRIDWYATGLWLFHAGGTIRDAARRYVALLAADTPKSLVEKQESPLPDGSWLRKVL